MKARAWSIGLALALATGSAFAAGNGASAAMGDRSAVQRSSTADGTWGSGDGGAVHRTRIGGGAVTVLDYRGQPVTFDSSTVPTARQSYADSWDETLERARAWASAGGDSMHPSAHRDTMRSAQGDSMRSSHGDAMRMPHGDDASGARPGAYK